MRGLIIAAILTLIVPATAKADQLGAKIITIPGDPDWPGMFLTNVGTEPVTVSSITFNGRDDCIAVVHPVAKTMLSYLKYETGMMFFPLTNAQANDEDFEPLPVQVNVGDRVPIMRPRPCAVISRATVKADQGIQELEFAEPLTFH